MKRYQTGKILLYFIGAANGVRLQRYSGLDTGVVLERFTVTALKNIIRAHACIV